MAVVVGYVATKEGRAALRRAAEECELRHTRLIVINSQRGGKDFDADEAAKFEAELETIQKKLTDLGLQNEVRQLVRGNEPAEDLIAVAEEGDAAVLPFADEVLRIPLAGPFFEPLLAVVPLHIFAMGLATAKGLDVDQPRNLAKSVTVE